MKVYQLITALADYRLDDDVFFDARTDIAMDVTDMSYDPGREAVIIALEENQ